MYPQSTPRRARVRVLASSSSGNAAFLRVGDTRLLLDVGIAWKRITQALRSMEEDPRALTAAFITHEHSDHIAGLERLLHELPDLPIDCTDGTAEKIRKRVALDHRRLRAGTPLELADGLRLTPFPLSHDAAEPVGFRIDAPGFAMALATDLGAPTDEVEAALRDCQLLLLEANHCPDLLANSPYPIWLRRRIASRRGHLSNDQAQALLARVLGPRLQRVVLCHLSEENNSPHRAHTIVQQALERAGRSDVTLEVAHPAQPGPTMDFAPTRPQAQPQAQAQPRQLSLF